MSVRAFITALTLALLVWTTPAWSGGHSTPQQAKALFEEAVAYMQANGPEKSFDAFNNPRGKFVQGDLYVFALDLQGNYFASGANPGLAGFNVRETRDAAGNPLFKDMIELARTKGEGTVSYVWLDRLDNRLDHKTSYIKRIGDYLIGVGYYTPRASPEQARALLDRAVAYMQKEGAQKAFSAFSGRSAGFAQDDLYVFVIDMDGTFHATGNNPQAVVGLNVRDTRDAAGNPLFQEMITMAKSRGEGKVDYVWRNPVNNRVENKESFVRRVDNYILGVGYYRD
ncbi:MAG TPA: cache domain-containing protein [Burkholderiales bacterium]|nr:cache domain-containing protein [Burkholderiales bacterium]